MAYASMIAIGLLYQSVKSTKDMMDCAADVDKAYTDDCVVLVN